LIAAGMLAIIAAPLMAEEDGEAEDATMLDRVVVTGSRIPRPDFASASPIVTVPGESFEQTGAPTVEATLNKFPQFVPGFTSTSNNPSAGGQAQLDLRGLGPQATLVLLDGRRLTPATGSGVADVNIIPPSLIERVEIITGGASAVYGSDAVAGVVNFILKPYYEGFEVGGFGARTAEGDGEQWEVSVTAGTRIADGRGSVYAYASRAEREIVTYGDRAFSRYALAYVGEGLGTTGPGSGFIASGSVATEEGYGFVPPGGGNPYDPEVFDALFQSYGVPAGTVPLQPLIGVNADGTLFTGGTFAPGSVVNFRGETDPLLFTDRRYTYNFAPPNALQMPLERTSLFGRASYDVSARASFYAEALYADYSVSQQLAPTPLDFVSTAADNPFLPADFRALLESRPNPAAPVFWLKRLSELGPRVSEIDYDTLQLTSGFEADVTYSWRLDGYLQYGHSDQDQRQTGNALRSRVEELTFAPDGGVAQCGGFVIFGRGSISPECASYIAADGTNRVEVSQLLSEMTLEGPLLDLPAGELRTALGVLYKRQDYAYSADPIAAARLPDGRPEISGFNAADDIDASLSNLDLYVEAFVPILLNAAGVRSLEAGLGFRYSDYDSGVHANAYKAELVYQPLDALGLRGSFQRAVRAPSIFELFQPQLDMLFVAQTSSGILLDPCTATSSQRSGPDAAQVEGLCIAQGVPADLLTDFEDADNLVPGFAGGNPDLDPEDADTFTLGLVWTPADLRVGRGRLQASLDWYRVELQDAIELVPGTEVLNLCFDPSTNPTFSPDNYWCRQFDRNAVTGEIENLFEINQNIGGKTVSGVDLQLDWRRALGPGEVRLNWLVSWLDSYEFSAGGGAPTEERAGTTSKTSGVPLPGGSLPEWKWTLAASYAWRGLDVTARWRHVDSMEDGQFPEFEVPSRDYIDLYARYDFAAPGLDGLTVGIGIENLTDEHPPIYPSYVQANTDPSQFDVLGRRYFLRLNYAF
jgi:iron complex outermembrane recepter protein